MSTQRPIQNSQTFDTKANNQEAIGGTQQTSGQDGYGHSKTLSTTVKDENQERSKGTTERVQVVSEGQGDGSYEMNQESSSSQFTLGTRANNDAMIRTGNDQLSGSAYNDTQLIGGTSSNQKLGQEKGEQRDNNVRGTGKQISTTSNIQSKIQGPMISSGENRGSIGFETDSRGINHLNSNNARQMQGETGLDTFDQSYSQSTSVKNTNQEFKMSTSQRVQISSGGQGQNQLDINQKSSTSQFVKGSKSNNDKIGKEQISGEEHSDAQIIGRPSPNQKSSQGGNKIRDSTSPVQSSYNATSSNAKNSKMNSNGKANGASVGFGTESRDINLHSKNIQQIQGEPGPGAYDQSRSLSNTIKVKNPEWSMGSAEREQILKEGPGPGQYDIVQENSSSQFTIGSKTNNDKMIRTENDQFPGPGYYDAQLIGSTSPNYTFNERREDDRDKNIPGPGQYSQNSSNFQIKMSNSKMGSNGNGASVGFGTESRDINLHSKNVKSLQGEPGPGAYSVAGMSNGKMTSGKFGKDQRQKDQQMNSPGPGAYEKLDGANNKGQSIKMGTERRPQTAKINEFIPGPGAYDQSSKLFSTSNGSSQKMSKAARNQANVNNTPGPGMYESESLNSNSRTKAPTSKFGTQKREYEMGRGSENPGPANYNSDMTKKGPSYQFGIKTNGKMNDAPGPGAYEQNNQSTKDRSQGIKIGTSQRQGLFNSKSISDMPGPGNYNDTARQFGKGTQAFSMKGKHKESNSMSSPGPGAYEGSQKQSKASYSSKFGQSTRQGLVSKQNLDQPGPGNYNESNAFGKNGMAVGIRGRVSGMKDSYVPGPGAYTQNDRKTRAVTIGSSKRSDFIDMRSARNMPGPGNYSVIEERDESSQGRNRGGYTFNSKRQERQSQMPGPGQYNHDRDINKAKTQSIRFGQSKRQTDMHARSNSELPGPGNYNNDFKAFGKGGVAATMRGKRDDFRPNNLPGPGQYEQNSNATKDKSSNVKFGSSRRQEIVNKNTQGQPGPGNYNSDSDFRAFGKSGIQTSIRGKASGMKDNQNPGPGAYSYRENNTRAIVIGSSQRTAIIDLKSARNMPGPGNYSVIEETGDSSKTRQKGGFTFSGKHRVEGDNHIPGPGQYNQQDGDIVKFKSQSIRFGQSKRQTDMLSRSHSELPGPGNYNSDCDSKAFGKSGISASIRGKRDDFRPSNHPGPGTYDSNHNGVRDKAANTKFGSSMRQQLVSQSIQEMPGPGNYNSDCDFKAFGKSGISSSIRGKASGMKDNNNPGPGSYSQSDKKVRAVVIGSSRRDGIIDEKNARNMPGPGNYSLVDERDDTSKTRSNGGFTFSGKHKAEGDNHIPGPGQYNQQDGDIMKSKIQSVRFGQSKRQTDMLSRSLSEQPGPGNYYSDCEFNAFGKSGIAASIRGKRDDFRPSNSPGPGQYEQHLNATRDKPVNIKFGSSKRQDIVSKNALELPGPGNYDGDCDSKAFGKSGISASIRGKASGIRDNQFPGPGQYSQSDKKSRAVVIGSSQRDSIIDEKRAKNMPGPGNYSVIEEREESSQVRQKGGFTFSGKFKEDRDLQLPGPGQYNQQDGDIMKSKVQSVRFGQSKRQTDMLSRSLSEMPGPGNYNSDCDSNAFGKSGISASIRGKREDFRPSKNPGPGSYEQNQTSIRDKPANTKFGSSKRQDIVSQTIMELPGPGNCDNDNDSKAFGRSGISASIKGKASDKRDNQFPGPGQYSQSEKKSRAVVIGSSKREAIIDEKKSKNMPGPGNYSIDERDELSQTRKKQGFTFSGKYKEDGDNHIPGPGQYNQHDGDIVKGQTQSIRFGQSKRQTDMLSKSLSELPGPGYYNSDCDSKAFGKSGIAASIRGKRDDFKPSDHPGPGSYEQNQNGIRDKPSNVKFGSSKRQEIVSQSKQELPGPGNYEYDSDSKAFGKSGISTTIRGKASELKDNKTPGPGSYSQSEKKTRAIVIGSSKREGFVDEKNARNMPGPGNYEVIDEIDESSQTKSKGISYTFSGKHKQEGDNHIPGPGQYNQEDGDIMKAKSQSIKFGSAKRQTDIMYKSDNDMPGPGNYDNDADFNAFGKSGTAASIRGKRDDFKPSDHPGPGAYEQNQSATRDKPANVKFGSSKRQDIVDKQSLEMPGPGNYDNDADFNAFGKSGVAASIREKRDDFKPSDHPGPGAYEQNQNGIKDKPANVKLGSSQRQELVSKSIQELPGPGNYEYDSDSKTFGKSGIATSIRGKASEMKDNNIPGPGSYSQSEQRTRAVVIGSSKRSELIDSKNAQNMPGPGNYDVILELDEGVSYTFTGKHKGEGDNHIPGPGQYNQEDGDIMKAKSQSIKFGSAKRQTDLLSNQNTDMPGPGNYNNDADFNTFGKSGVAVSIRGKRDDLKPSDHPGPGSYEQNQDAIRDQSGNVKFGNSQRQDIVSKSIMELPGPGNYDNESDAFGKNGISASIRGKANEAKYNDHPGPGSYEQNQDSVRDKAANVKFGSSQRQDIVDKSSQEMPGPGNYENANDSNAFGKSGIAASIRGKRDDFKPSDHPGPGAYEQNQSPIKDQSANVKFGNSQRQDIVDSNSRDIPGPGNYENDQNTFGKSGISTSIRGKGSEFKPSDHPGPGSYEQNQASIKDQSANVKFGSSQRQDFISKESQELPGPGNYDNDSNAFGKNSISASIRGKGSEFKPNDHPGPGSYEQNQDSIRDKSGNVKFGNSQRQDIVDSNSKDIPGPGNYDSDSNAFGKSGISTSIRGKGNDFKPSDHPGPGTYEQDQSIIRDQSANVKFGNSQRQDIVDSKSRDIPGPGNYDNDSNTFGKSGISTTIRGKGAELKVSDRPGPGSYEQDQSAIRDQSANVKFGTSQRQEFVSENMKEMPGPGNYDNDADAFGKSGIATSIRGKREESKPIDHPGPGTYEQNQDSIREKSPNVKFGNSQRQDIVDKNSQEMPGPGNYDNDNNVNSFGKSGISTSIRGKGSEFKPNDYPGPGSYEQNQDLIRDQSANVKFGSSQREDIVSKGVKELPGPGNYDNDADFNAFGKTGIATSIRGKGNEIKPSDHPGPGSYEQNQSAIRDQSANVKFGNSQRQDIVDISRRDIPGPGNYDNDTDAFGKTGISATIQGRRDDKLNDYPGPGTYEQNQDAIREQSANIKFGSSQRQDFVSKDSQDLPGPGNYDNDTNAFGNSGISTSIRGKGGEQKIIDHPGPGTYEQNQDSIREKSANVKFGTSQRQDITGSNIQTAHEGTNNYGNGNDFNALGGSVISRGKAAQLSNEGQGSASYDHNQNSTTGKSGNVKSGSNQKQGGLVDSSIQNKSGTKGSGKGGIATSSKGQEDKTKSKGLQGSGSYDQKQDQIKEYSDSLSQNSQEMSGSGSFVNQRGSGKSGLATQSKNKQDNLKPSNSSASIKHEQEQHASKVKASNVKSGGSQNQNAKEKSRQSINSSNTGSKATGKGGVPTAAKGKGTETQQNEYSGSGQGSFEQDQDTISQNSGNKMSSSNKKQGGPGGQGVQDIGSSSITNQKGSGKNGVSTSIKGQGQKGQSIGLQGSEIDQQNQDQITKNSSSYKQGGGQMSQSTLQSNKNQTISGSKASGKSEIKTSIKGQRSEFQSNEEEKSGDTIISTQKQGGQMSQVVEQTSSSASIEISQGKNGGTITTYKQEIMHSSSSSSIKYEQTTTTSIQKGSSQRQELIGQSTSQQLETANENEKSQFGKLGPQFTQYAKPSRKDLTISPGPNANYDSNNNSLVRPGLQSVTLGQGERNNDETLLGSSRVDSSIRGQGSNQSTGGSIQITNQNTINQDSIPKGKGQSYKGKEEGASQKKVPDTIQEAPEYSNLDKSQESKKSRK